jgi:hypothetical protein
MAAIDILANVTEQVGRNHFYHGWVKQTWLDWRLFHAQKEHLGAVAVVDC